jgi:hypothetical protein
MPRSTSLSFPIPQPIAPTFRSWKLAAVSLTVDVPDELISGVIILKSSVEETHQFMQEGMLLMGELGADWLFFRYVVFSTQKTRARLRIENDSN